MEITIVTASMAIAVSVKSEIQSGVQLRLAWIKWMVSPLYFKAARLIALPEE